MTLPSCNPKLGYGVTQVMSTHYPERLGLAICVNHNPVFQGIWNAIKVFLHPNTAAKMNLVRGKKKIQETFDKYFSEEVRDWLLEEMTLNKEKPLPEGQRFFWEAPSESGGHDPRACPSYVKTYIEPLIAEARHKEHQDEDKGATSAYKLHKPHPNLVDAAFNRIPGSALGRTANGNNNAKAELRDLSSDSEEMDSVQELEISDEFQIPKDAVPIH